LVELVTLATRESIFWTIGTNLRKGRQNLPNDDFVLVFFWKVSLFVGAEPLQSFSLVLLRILIKRNTPERLFEPLNHRIHRISLFFPWGNLLNAKDDLRIR
jgi:hypothetical protein